MATETNYKVQNWVVILIINIFLGLGAWQMNLINSNLEKLNESVIRFSEKLITIEKRLDSNDEKWDLQEKRSREFYQKYDLKLKK